MSAARVRCPACQRELDWAATPSRPFCSERCRLVDLGAWLTERHFIPDESSAAQDGVEREPPLKGSS